jgi:isoquinoline 1-oxidoreductase alpha subunit
MISFKLNNEPVSFEGDSETPLLWVLRDHLRLTGTKFGCGIGLCGSCVVHLNGRATTSCVVPVSAVAGQAVTTIEGLAAADGELHPVQKAWLELDVAQCGYCQSGQIMATADFLKRYPNPTDQDIDDNLDNMLCRCGTYVRIRKAIHRAAEMSEKGE